MDRVWRAVVGWEGLYEVSDIGDVRSVPRITKTERGQRHLKGKPISSWSDGTGHRLVGLYKSGKVTNRSLHTLVLEAFTGPRPDGMEGCHNDGDPSNNSIGNLRWDTRKGNVADSFKHGTHNWANRTECKYGHPFTPENLYVSAKGTRRCRACNLTSQSKRKKAKWAAIRAAREQKKEKEA